jgi:hypothetical protein
MGYAIGYSDTKGVSRLMASNFGSLLGVGFIKRLLRASSEFSALSEISITLTQTPRTLQIPSVGPVQAEGIGKALGNWPGMEVGALVSRGRKNGMVRYWGQQSF